MNYSNPDSNTINETGEVLLMKKRILCVILVAAMLLGGCQKPSDKYLAYHDTATDVNVSNDDLLTQGDFFGKDLTIISNTQDNGGDDQLTAGALLFVNNTKNEMIYADKVYQKLYPASLTKLMTALIVFKYGKLMDNVKVSYNASHITEVGAKTCGLKEGDVLSMQVLLNSMLVYSGNDTAIAIAEHIGGSVDGFSDMMNKEAKRIGAVHSHFVNPNGLHSDEQYTTAYDLYLIFHELLKYDEFKQIIHQSSYTANYVDKDGYEKQGIFDTTNQYLKGEASTDPELTVIGGKTGTTSKAGNCLVLLSEGKDNQDYISVILKANGSVDLYTEMSRMLSKFK